MSFIAATYYLGVSEKNMSNYSVFTSEAVPEGHPDKLADQIADAVVDATLKDDTDASISTENMVKTVMAIVAEEVRTYTYAC
mgnify:CR=1 FL=1